MMMHRKYRMVEFEWFHLFYLVVYHVAYVYSGNLNNLEKMGLVFKTK